MLLEREQNYGWGMDALVSGCSWKTNGIMVWAWMLWSAYAPGTRTEVWFGHGCSGQRMLLEHGRNYGLLWSAQRMLLEHERSDGLGMDALVSVCSWNTNGIMVRAWMLWSAYALGTRTGRARALGAPGAKLLVSPIMTAILLPVHNPSYNPL